jgi:hypothetical protein
MRNRASEEGHSNRIRSLVSNSLIRQQRRTFTVFRHNFTTTNTVLAQKLRETDAKGENEEETANRERKDPLELKNWQLGEELANAGGCISC